MRIAVGERRHACKQSRESPATGERAATERDPDRALRIFLRVLGAIDCLAFLAVVMPEPWMASLHTGLGLGELPAAPVVGYLTRSASLLYALHGAMIWYVSFDIARYRPLIAFLAWMAVIHGGMLVAIDLWESMPTWWVWSEGPVYALLATIVLILLRRGSKPPV